MTSNATSRGRFAAQTALVTGAGTGIGRAIALAFAAEGANVVVAGRTEASLKETVRLIEAASGTALAVTTDVTRAEDLRTLVETAVGRFGSLDVAVNNAGVLRGGPAVADLPEDDWGTVVDTNLTGVFLALRAEVGQMRTQPSGGAIVNISSNLGAHLSVPGLTAYSASKAAVTALTRGAALDHIQDGVRINAVSPGSTQTTMSMRPGETEAERTERMRSEAPVGRTSTTAEIAAAVLYLASSDAASAVGTDLVVDGGSSA
ncbi:Glucose 1-dehydrogenase 4 [Streptomyces sp. YIM 130001]|uniref:SDR family NAD(P)-dependent oxidoreductase n=1 Tax=Streptomyces sp. YIM 130001 TaxID=2259644 RepID=UPI000E6526CC|nr:SDR family oxidoreductase [Streptomyces sp. YIM 130001]RII20938.1 Glucose 1-dehydrogenase 4 [Streptomyces sp. YIM 130001]